LLISKLLTSIIVSDCQLLHFVPDFGAQKYGRKGKQPTRISSGLYSLQ
jgi:hypothetical protein